MEEPKYKSSYEGIQVDNAVSGFVNTIGNSSLEDHKNDYRTVLDRKESTIAENKLLTLGRDGFLVDSGLSKGEVVTRDELDATVNLSAISQTGNTALYPIRMKKVPTHPDATPSGYTVDGEGLEYPRMFGWLTEEANNKYREHLYAVISNNDPMNKVFVNTVYEVYPDDDKVFSNRNEIPSDGDGIASGFHPVSLLPVTSEGVSTETNPSFVVTYMVSLDVDRQEIRLRWYDGNSWKDHVSVTRKASLSVPFGVYTQSDKLLHVFYADDGGMEVQNVDPVGGNVIGGPSLLLDRSSQLDDNGNAVMDSTMDSPVLVQIGASTYMLVYQTNASKGLGYPLEVRYAYVRYDGSAHEFHVLQNPATLFRIKGKMVNSPYVSRTGSGRLVFSFHSNMDYVGGDGYGNGAIHREGFYVYTTLKKVYGGTDLRQSDLMPLYSPVTDTPNGWSGGYGSTFSMGSRQYFIFTTGTNPKLDTSVSEMVRLGMVDYEKDMEGIYEYIDRAIVENGNMPIPPKENGQYMLTTNVSGGSFAHSWSQNFNFKGDSNPMIEPVTEASLQRMVMSLSTDDVLGSIETDIDFAWKMPPGGSGTQDYHRIIYKQEWPIANIRKLISLMGPGNKGKVHRILVFHNYTYQTTLNGKTQTRQAQETISFNSLDSIIWEEPGSSNKGYKRCVLCTKPSRFSAYRYGLLIVENIGISTTDMGEVQVSLTYDSQNII